MRPTLRSRLGGSALWLGAGSALWLGCDGPEPRELRLAAAPSMVDDEDGTTTGPEPALAAAGEPAMAVDAEAHSPEVLEPVERRRFQAAVSEGHRLHEAHDYEGALAAYARALDLVPGDPRTLSDQGWAALFAGRLDEADAALRQAEAAAGDEPRLRASILYNRGRVAEARGEVPEAIDAYQRSLRLRPHPATYQHLTALAGGTRYQFGPEVRRLQGPYGKLGELCQEERLLAEAAGEGDDAEPFACLSDAAKGLYADAVDVATDRSLPSPWKALRFVETRPNAWSVRLHAALRTDGGWFVLPDVATLGRGTPGTTESVTRLSAHAEPLFGVGGSAGVAEVVLEVETRWAVAEEGKELESETHRVEFLCGLGPSGIPACTGALPRATVARRHGPGEESTRWTVERRATPEGLLMLEGDRDALDEPAAAVLGAHRIAFP